jgi:hypothetical protein
MRKSPFLLTLASSSLALMAISSSAGPLASGLASDSATLPALNKGLIQKVQASWPCGQKRKDMTAEDRRFCYYYHHRYYYGYPVYEYGHPAYGYSYPVYRYRAYGYPVYRYRAYGYPVYRYPAYGYGYGYPVYGAPY